MDFLQAGEASIFQLVRRQMRVLHQVAGENDGEYTDTDLVIDSAGNLYGTSVQGGDFGGGTVFQLAPSGNGWTHTVLYSFTGGSSNRLSGTVALSRVGPPPPGCTT